MERPPRVYAFILTLMAFIATALPVYYTFHVYDSFGNLGRWIAIGVAVTAFFGMLTVTVSVARAFIRPAVASAARKNRRTGGSARKP